MSITVETMGCPQEFGDGWVPLVNELLSEISKITPYCRPIQTKEKFGLLRVYLEFDYDENGECVVREEDMERIFSLVRTYEDRSEFICEECGEPGEVGVLRGWVFVRCENHRSL